MQGGIPRDQRTAPVPPLPSSLPPAAQTPRFYLDDLEDDDNDDDDDDDDEEGPKTNDGTLPASQPAPPRPL